VYNYGRDRLTHVTALVSTSGAISQSYRYEPWGEPLGFVGTLHNPFQYTSSYNDGNGLYMMGARYYQPVSGRFTRLDPLPESIISLNRYAYAGCNPTNFIDPTGLEEECSAGEWALSVVGAIASGVGLGAAIASVPATGPIGGTAAVSLAASAVGAAVSVAQLTVCIAEELDFP
jgi:RHS repeat-associated protein